MNYSLFISCPRGLEYLLEEELKALGLMVTRVNPQGVYGEANLLTLYKLCLWSRIANRVQLILFSGYAGNEQALHQLCTQFHWQTVFSQDKTIAIEFHGSSEQIRNTMFGAQVVKDGIVDHFRRLNHSRPSVDKENPQILIHAYLKNDVVTVSFDLTGYSLHQRGYRRKAGAAPLKENVAAALLMRAKWPELAAKGYALHDPFCGAGTLVIEAAMMAAHIAPGLLRQDQSLQYWAQHQSSLWEKMRVEALQQVKPVPVTLLGTDADHQIITIARANAERAGVAPLVEFKTQALKEIEASTTKGLVVCNPPYGERLSDVTHLVPLYQQLGKVLHAHYQGWKAAVLTSNPILAKSLGLRASKQYTLYNGALECKLYCLDIHSANELKGGLSNAALSESAQMLLNRLEKNYRHLHKWATKNNISCFRIYDADLPEYAYAIDVYNDYAVLQEYAAPASIPAHKAEKRSLEVIQVVPRLLKLEPNHLIVKQRKPQKGREQYQKLGQSQKSMVVTEGQAKLKVNLYDYLDTGLFLDHRIMRLNFAQLKPGTRFLNCFCYTASASVHAALAGALTTNVDLSNTYLRWAEDNFKLNHLDLSKHQFVQADCREWMRVTRERFDVIFLDPPSFSNSKRMTDTLDIQRDHVVLVNSAMRLLNPNGVLYFSTNLRQFKLEPLLKEKYSVQDISAQTIDQDFKRNQKIHHCFKIMMTQFAPT
ncbi:bifunctional 23S rRNA (guanine(2069)-N(7))-methyltransferase RlmK/23S rRNA (guanine(2445)-N(2))-methyltransferase RlmL [Fluoribacter dumoffii]|uniref:bifunctional 23S rRNA (guanine(2069)-N(7))-methyltransferase RlmK/23S rRNA (guanine(2445)-N(2))-methyltransferase RlmL n=1 Tax=Fluoribacter dumoffii TaxID=463 RepID=UPI0022437115|nr:bifunctional 23S rRNA (guanine(2069)-N(7))-methyltransferase RlmK/23S rRNA (guanine(2445)-N(2))-methyltransferase RlmL [Fluoribacter dumoffii]MCW8387364.1 bifunctional 23S rRNA (guanine(2069)-N(7))-methyltransferase RlmK/23S rRNA (guanine(2445)-N(2))-methyltransferase RlmL [Fluoribacter dumoffii]MCW8497568.1 bifunctional 23S rRNA (guanine(2069)-N(7))-methyltransferase RlmK/23S rRNA (guanine(2445)-N(2))-methyltransferase RlmL [Fluoribacter dumoffii]